MTTTTPTSTKPKRRWLRFSLRTLLVVSVLIGFGCTWIGMQLQQKRRHEAVVKEIERLGGNANFVDVTPIPVWKERIFGVYAVGKWSMTLNESGDTDSILAQMKGMNCFYLQLQWAKITDAGLTHLPGLSNLELLDLSNTQITDAGLAHLKGLTSLEWLYLCDTQITDAGLPHLKSMTSLGVLYLNDTQITDAGLAHLKGLNNLLELQFESTSVTKQGVDKLQKAIPGCKITYSPIETSGSNSP